jgi:hypothetical protein
LDGTAEELFVPMLHLGLRANGIALPTIGNIGMVGHIPDVARPGTERCPTTGRNTLGPDGIAMRPNLGGRQAEVAWQYSPPPTRWNTRLRERNRRQQCEAQRALCASHAGPRRRRHIQFI